MSTDPSGGTDPGLRFETTPYQPDGGCPPLGWLLILLLGVPVAAGTGYLTAWAFPYLMELIAQVEILQLYLLLMAAVFVMFALPVIAVVRVAVRLAKVRNPGAVTAAALLVWATMVGTAVFVEYDARFRPGLPELMEAEVASYITFGVVSLITGAMIVAGARQLASQPFCAECRTWKKVRFRRKVGLPPQVLLRAVRTGDVLPLADCDVSREGMMTLTVTACPNCGLDAPSEVKLEQTTTDSRGRPVVSVLAHVSYPGSAAVVLEEIFRPESPST
jgi:hypothetical protein